MEFGPDVFCPHSYFKACLCCSAFWGDTFQAKSKNIFTFKSSNTLIQTSQDGERSTQISKTNFLRVLSVSLTLSEIHFDVFLPKTHRPRLWRRNYIMLFLHEVVPEAIFILIGQQTQKKLPYLTSQIDKSCLHFRSGNQKPMLSLLATFGDLWPF